MSIFVIKNQKQKPKKQFLGLILSNNNFNLINALPYLCISDCKCQKLTSFFIFYKFA